VRRPATHAGAALAIVGVRLSEKALAVAWFPLGALPPNRTITARRAIDAYLGSV